MSSPDRRDNGGPPEDVVVIGRTQRPIPSELIGGISIVTDGEGNKSLVIVGEQSGKVIHIDPNGNNSSK